MSEHHHDAHGHAHHIVPVSTYLIVFAALLVLLVITVAVAFVNLGNFNLPIALVVACIKAVLIMMFFMEVKYQSKLVWVFSGASFVFLMIMLVLTMNDYLTRAVDPHAGY
jgi:cytochrome c oxidase subunit IV